MSKNTEEGGPRDCPIYAVEMREDGDVIVVAIVRLSRDEDAGSPSVDVWTNRFANVEAARVIVAFLMSLPERWSPWARMAEILGSDFLTGVIESEVVGAARVARNHAEAGANAFRRLRQARTARTVHLSLVLAPSPRIVAMHGGRGFMTLKLETSIEARRIWDWVRWQAHSFQDWFVLVQICGATALEVLILNATRIAEETAKADGIATNGPRPLRYLRPASGPPTRSRKSSGAKDGSEGGA